jgi:hypothetical protein
VEVAFFALTALADPLLKGKHNEEIAVLDDLFATYTFASRSSDRIRQTELRLIGARGRP